MVGVWKECPPNRGFLFSFVFNWYLYNSDKKDDVLKTLHGQLSHFMTNSNIQFVCRLKMLGRNLISTAGWSSVNWKLY